MWTDDVGAIQGALGNIEDSMAEMNVAWAHAAGAVADFELWKRIKYLEVREELKAERVWSATTTETAKKDDIETRMFQRWGPEFEQHRKDLRAKAIGDKLFAGLDARRSIGQTLMKPHLRDDPKYGQEAHGQHGTREPRD